MIKQNFYLGACSREIFTNPQAFNYELGADKSGKADEECKSTSLNEMVRSNNTLLIDNQSEEICWQKVGGGSRYWSQLLYGKLLRVMKNSNFTAQAWTKSEIIIQSFAPLDEIATRTSAQLKTRADKTHDNRVPGARAQVGQGVWARVIGVELEVAAPDCPVPHNEMSMSDGLELMSVSLLREAAYQQAGLPLDSSLVVCLQPDGEIRHMLFFGGCLRFSRLQPSIAARPGDTVRLGNIPRQGSEPAHLRIEESESRRAKLVSEVQSTLRYLSSNPDLGRPGRVLVDVKLQALLSPVHNTRGPQSGEQLVASRLLAAGSMDVDFIELPDVLIYFCRLQNSFFGKRKLAQARLTTTIQRSQKVKRFLFVKPGLPLSMLVMLAGLMLTQSWQAMSLVQDSRFQELEAGNIERTIGKIPLHRFAYDLTADQVLDVLDLHNSTRFRSSAFPSRVLLAIAKAVSTDLSIQIESLDWAPATGSLSEMSVQTIQSARQQPSIHATPGKSEEHPSSSMLTTRNRIAGEHTGNGRSRSSLLEQVFVINLNGSVVVGDTSSDQTTAAKIEEAYANYLRFLERLETGLRVNALEQIRPPFGLAPNGQTRHTFKGSERVVDNRFTLHFTLRPSAFLSATQSVPGQHDTPAVASSSGRKGKFEIARLAALLSARSLETQ